MAVAEDTTLIGTGSGPGVNSLTLSNFSTGGANRLVLVISDESQNTSTIGSVTATGLTFTLVQTAKNNTTSGNLEIWGAWASAQQTNVAVTVNYINNNFPHVACRTMCFSGTDITGTVVAAVGATKGTGFSGNPSDSVTTTRDNSLVIAGFGGAGIATYTAGTGQTISEQNTAGTGNFATVGGMTQNATTTPSGTSVTMNATMSAAFDNGLVIVEILPPANPASKFLKPNALRPRPWKPGIAR